MNSNKLWMTAPSTASAAQSCFGMPISGHAFGTATPAAEARTATTLVVRDRAVKAIQGAVMGFAQSYFPGTSAWRPPTC